MYRGVASEIRTQFLCFLFLGFLSRVYTFAFWDQLLNQFKNYNFKIKYFDVKRSLWKVSKESKSCSHQTRGQMEDVKVDLNSWPRYGIKVFVVSGLVLGRFFIFYFELLGQVYEFNFWYQTLSLFLGISILGLEILTLKVLFKAQKLQKTTKSCTHQSRGHMGYFKLNQNSWLRYGNSIFALRFKICTCGVGLKIRTRFYVFQKYTFLVRV